MYARRMLDAQVDAEVPLCVHWTYEKVASWVEHIGYPQYKQCFISNFINGRKLILLEMSRLPEIGITDYKHMKEIAQNIRELLRQPTPDYWHTISSPERDKLGLYLEMKVKTGKRANSMEYSQFLKQNKLLLKRMYWREEEKGLNL